MCESLTSKLDKELDEQGISPEDKICLTPFREIGGGSESIYDYVDSEYTVPEKVLTYLTRGDLYVLSPGVYEHPFKKGTHLPGPYTYTDGYYYWDRDTWEYVLKYHVRLPEEFIDYVMAVTEPNTLPLIPDCADGSKMEDF